MDLSSLNNSAAVTTDKLGLEWRLPMGATTNSSFVYSNLCPCHNIYSASENVFAFFLALNLEEVGVKTLEAA